MSFSSTGPSPLLHYESFPWGTVHQECAAFTGCSSGLKIASVWAPCMGHESCQEPAPAWAPHGLQFPLGPLFMLWFCVLHVLAGWIFAPLWTCISCRRTTCIVTVFSIGCNGISALVPAEPLPLPPSVTLASAGLVLRCFLISLSQTGFLPFPKYVITEVHWCHLWVQPGTAVGLSNTGQLLVSSHRAHPCQNLALNTYSCSNSRAICFFKYIPYGFDTVLRGY